MKKDIKVKNIELINGETYKYRHYLGGNKKLVLIHGNMATSLFYNELINALPKEYTIYALDLRGCGGSTYNRPINSLRDLAGDVKLFVDQLQLTNFDLLGWSTGGAVSMLFTSSYGHMVKRLFLVASAGVSGYHSYSINDKGVKKLIKSKKELSEDKNKQAQVKALKNKDLKFYKKLWDNGIYNIDKPPLEIYKKQLEDSILQKNIIDILHGLNSFNISNYYNGLTMGTNEAKNIKVPTTIIQGEDDLLVSVAEARELKAAIGNNAKLIIVENCGHSPMVDALDILVNAITTN